jgi:hypothetical protein
LAVTAQPDRDGDEARRAPTLEGFPAPERGDLTMASLRIGSIQPSRQGVVAW